LLLSDTLTPHLNIEIGGEPHAAKATAAALTNCMLPP